MLEEEKKDINTRFSRFLAGIHHSGFEALDGICAGNSSLINVLNWTGRGSKGGWEFTISQQRVRIKAGKRVMLSFWGMNKWLFEEGRQITPTFRYQSKQH